MSGEGQPTAELFCGVANLMNGSQRNQAAIGITEIKRGGQRPPKRRSTHLAQDRCCSYEGNGVCLEAALLCEARLDRRDVSFAITQRVVWTAERPSRERTQYRPALRIRPL